METGKLKLFFILAGLFMLGYYIGVEIGIHMQRMEQAAQEYRRLKDEIESHFIGAKNGNRDQEKS